MSETFSRVDHQDQDQVDDPGSLTVKRQISLILGRPTLQRTQTSDLLEKSVSEEAAKRQEEAKKKREKSQLAKKEKERKSSVDASPSPVGSRRGSLQTKLKTRRKSSPVQDESEDVEPWKTPQEKPDLSYIPVKTKEPEPVVTKQTTYDSSDFYDTDLEEDVAERHETPQDTWGCRTYHRLCRRLRISTVGAVTAGLKSSQISVKGRGMDATDALALSSALMENLLVTSLSLDDNQLGPRGTEYICLMLFENHVISDLSVADNRIGSRGCALLMEMLLENSVITKLNLSGNNLSDSDAYLVAIVLQDNHTVTNLSLSHNNISDEGAKALGMAVAENECLRTLDLSWNKIRPKGGIAFCDGIEGNVVLTTLSLAYNGLCILGAQAMGQALELNEVLTDLDLTCNRMFDEGAAHLARALLTNETLQCLRISNNALTTASATTMLHAIKENPDSAVNLLDISSMHIYKDALTLVEEIKFTIPKFKFLYGGVVNSDDSFGGEGKMLSQRNPMAMLREFMEDRNMRIVDLFKQLDKDGSGSVSRDEFIEGLKTINVPMTNAQIDRLIRMLDRDGDGEIELGEMITGDREHRRKQMKLKQAALARMKKLKREKKLAKMKAKQQAETNSSLPLAKRQLRQIKK